MKRIRRLLSGLKVKYWKVKDQLETKTLLGQELITVKGTIVKEDYDDAWFYLLARQSKVIFDIGANIGYTALLASVGGNAQRIVLVDPNPEALVCAAKNLILNNLSGRCSYVTGFVGDKPGEKIKFYSIGYGAAGSMYASHAKTASTLDSYYWVETITIDLLVDQYQVQPDFVKIDVEGAEALVLQGATQLARQGITRFFVEMHATEEVSMEQNANRIIEWANEIGYKVWYLKEEVQITSGAAIASRGKCHLLLQHGNFGYPEFLLGVKEKAELRTISH
ncbi:MAG: FkbM family methyltransferase [Cyclobacteriaceae bacterium]|nr:FkbM family methyltransferase [Cyclobacteriaceae bacterium]